MRSSHLSRTYGLTFSDYNRILKEQSEGCAICGKPPNGKRLSVDHDHKSNKVRGLLCMHCNVILGHAFEKIETLENAISYLKKHYDQDWDIDLLVEKLKACGV